MRIIGGQHRGRKIKQPPLDTVRPTKDRIREAVFNMIAEKVPASSVLDLFSGSGAYGLEALSRGARSCIFVEKSPECAGVLEENIDLLKAGEKSEVKITDSSRAIQQLGEAGSKFDLIFCDPPYNAHMGRNILIMINQYDILNPAGELIVEHSAGEELPREEGSVSIYKQKTYGDISVSLFIKKWPE